MCVHTRMHARKHAPVRTRLWTRMYSKNMLDQAKGDSGEKVKDAFSQFLQFFFCCLWSNLTVLAVLFCFLLLVSSMCVVSFIFLLLGSSCDFSFVLSWLFHLSTCLSSRLCLSKNLHPNGAREFLLHRKAPRWPRHLHVSDPGLHSNCIQLKLLELEPVNSVCSRYAPESE